MKICSKCKEQKSISKFYKCKTGADGHFNKCKECTKKDVRNNRKKRIDYYRSYDRERNQSPIRFKQRAELIKIRRSTSKGKAKHNEQSRKWREQNKHKRRAYTKVWDAIRDRKLFQQPCEICGKSKANAHHDDYSKPLEVRWLCHKHHMEHHKNEREILRNKF